MDDALDLTEREGHTVKHVVVLDHKMAAKRSEVPWKEGRDKWWQDVMDHLPSECPVEWMDAEAPLFKVCLPLWFNFDHACYLQAEYTSITATKSSSADPIGMPSKP